MMYGYSPSFLTWESFNLARQQAHQQPGQIGACWTSRASSCEAAPALASAPATPPPEVRQPPCEGGVFRTSRAGSYAGSEADGDGTSSNSSSDTFVCSLAGVQVLLRGAPGLERMSQPPHGTSLSPALLDLAVNSQGSAAQSREVYSPPPTPYDAYVFDRLSL
mmetsp:Transcript_166272/g.403961  ORF Transcript_166272/g.403961 Transcript_166272/m.403961 type:complete len:163 (+) Transcript_166272:2-490(+)